MIIKVTPRSLLNIFFRHHRKFILTFLLVFGLAAAYCLIATPKYESNAALLVKFAPPQSSRADAPPSVGIAAQQLERKEIVNSQIGMMQSRDLLAEVLKGLTIAAVYPSLSSIDDDKHRMAAAVDRLDRDLDVVPQKDSNIIQLTLRHADPQVSAAMLRSLIDRFIARQSSIYQGGQLPFMQGQLDQARLHLEASRRAVQSFKAATGINSPDEERTLLLRQEADARESLTQAISKQQEAQGRYLRLEEMLKGMPSQIKLSDENDRFKAVDDARQRLDDLRARQKQMAVNYRADSSTMQSLSQEIAFASQQLTAASRQSAARVRTGANPVRQQAEMDLMVAAGDQSGATASRASYEAELNRIHERLGALESDAAHLDSLELQQQVDEENFRNYLQAVNDARVTDDLNRQRIGSIVVIQSPTIPVQPAKPRIPLILAAGLLLGLAAAVAVTLLSEMSDESFSTADQIEAILGLPVLGTFTLRPRAPHPAVPAYARILPLLALFMAAAMPDIARGYDLLDPSYGQRLAVRQQSGGLTEFLCPDDGRFYRVGINGQRLGYAKRVGSELVFYDQGGRRVYEARSQLLPPNYPITAIAVIRDMSGNPVAMISRH
jgi:succinoglycan biosynthesis transport protein ExoP